MYNMKEVAKKLGVELNERFMVRDDKGNVFTNSDKEPYAYFFTENGLYREDGSPEKVSGSYNLTLYCLDKGEYTLEPLPKRKYHIMVIEKVYALNTEIEASTELQAQQSIEDAYNKGLLDIPQFVDDKRHMGYDFKVTGYETDN